jgi:lauroyl/myristoyl acyltransferase
MKQRVLEISQDLAEWGRRRIPRALLPLVVALRARLAWSRAGVREDARAQMRFLLEKARPEADLESAAMAYVRRQVWRGELRWHPEMITQMRVEGMQHMRAAQSRGHGVMLNFMHHGSYEGALASVARLGAPADTIVYPYMLRPDAPRWLRQHIKVACWGGGRALSAEIGSLGMVDLLRQQRVVAVASDVPGRTLLPFAGRDVLGSSGAARIATDAGAPVVVMTSEEDENGTFVRLHEPLDPASFESAQELLQQMLATHERAILQWPEATDLPLSRWGVAEATT